VGKGDGVRTLIIAAALVSICYQTDARSQPTPPHSTWQDYLDQSQTTLRYVRCDVDVQVDDGITMLAPRTYKLCAEVREPFQDAAKCFSESIKMSMDSEAFMIGCVAPTGKK
jgi:hypothetical protein